MSCNKCKKHTCNGTCAPCAERIDSRCVIYKPNSSTSSLDCFLKLPTNVSVEKIVESIDSKLCNLFTVDLSPCVQTMLGLKKIVDLKLAFTKLLNYVCTQQDRLVKVSVNDTKSDYLFNKIVLGDCLVKTIEVDNEGIEQVKIDIDFVCFASKIPQCIEVDCCSNSGNGFNITSNVTTICGNNTVLLTSNGCLGTTLWFKNGVQVGSGATYTGTAGTYYASCNGNQSNTIVVTNDGPCVCIESSYVFTGQTRCRQGISELERVSNCGNFSWIAGGNACTTCTPVWLDIVPVEIYCGQHLNTVQNVNSFNVCSMYIKQNNQCNNDTRWVVYTGSGSENAGECPGCEEPLYTTERIATFTRENCGSGCTPGQITFTRVYSSTISLQNAIALKNADLYQFNIDGQAEANLNGTCSNCGCVPSETLNCTSLNNVITSYNSCGLTQGIITFDPLSYVCGSQGGVGTILASSTLSYGANTSNYLIQYAITAINGVNVSNPTWVLNGNFSNLADSTSYTITCRVTRGTNVCSTSRTLTLPECTLCTEDPGTISITSSSVSICGSQSVILNATSNNCGTIQWIQGTNTVVGTGSSLVVNPTQTTMYKARCLNCNGTVESNTVVISYTGPCETSCIEATFNNESGSAGTVTYINCVEEEITIPVANGSSETVCLLNSNAYSTSVSMNITYGSQCASCVNIQTIQINEN